MSRTLGLIATGAIALAVPALAAEKWSWSRSVSPDNSFSVETPCSAEEVDRAKVLPTDFASGVPLAPASRVVCMKGGIVLVAGMIQEDAWPNDGPSMFEELSNSAKGDPTAKGNPTLTMINGHRAYLNREVSQGNVAQTGMIEIGHSKIIFAAAGGAQGKTSMPTNEQGALVDRFYGSIQVAAK